MNYMGEMEEKFNKSQESIPAEKPRDDGYEKPEGLGHNPEVLAGKNIQEIEKRAEDLGLEKTGKSLFDKTDSIGIEKAEQEKILKESGIAEKLRDISERAGKLFKDTTQKIRMLIVGMTRAEYSEKIESTSEADQESARVILAESLEKESEIKEKLDELRKHIGSQEYLKKLQVEFDGDFEKARRAQKRRLVYLDFVKFSFVDKDDLGDNAIKWITAEIRGFVGLEKSPSFSIAGNYNEYKHEITLPRDRDGAMHEMLHASTKGNYDITEKAKAILTESYRVIGDEETDNYFGNASERLERKQALDIEMEKLGIIKYGERFTHEKYESMMEHYLSGGFSRDAEEFIETTKPEYFEKIFNNIAKNEKGKYNEVVRS